MTSAIDPSKPTAVMAYTADVRQNFQSAYDEITDIQDTFVKDSDFGAKGDGTTDDTAALNAAGATGKLVLITGTAYYLTGEVIGNFYSNRETAVTFTGPDTRAVVWQGTTVYLKWRIPFLGFRQIGNGGHFAQDGAVITRLSDRLFVGGATALDGQFPTVNSDWLTNFMQSHYICNPDGSATTNKVTGTGMSATLYTVPNETGAGINGIATGAQSAHCTQAYVLPLALTAVAVNNCPDRAVSGTIGTMAGYFEAHRISAYNGQTIGLEIDVRSTASDLIELGLTRHESVPSPFGQSTTTCLQIAAGAGVYDAPGTTASQLNIGTAIFIADNPTKFRVGITMSATALEEGTAPNYTGQSSAMLLGPGQNISWTNSNDGPGVPPDGVRHKIIGSIVGMYTTGTTRTNMVFANAGIKFTNSADQAIFYIIHADNVVNNIHVAGAATGQPVAIVAAGSDTNVDIMLRPQGAGYVVLGANSTGTADAPVAGYMSVKDINGIVRKLAYIA